MSMLAEPKRRQKWSLNPRGNEWSKDSNRFGQKLMERMGWKEGKGLGANEDGATEHIRVSYKNDIKGIGFKESIEWSHQQDNFSAFLNELNNSNTTDETTTAGKSLEAKSEKSRARVHYRKFTRGKDLSHYSEKDLANILGRRELKTKATPPEPQLEQPEASDMPPLQFGVNTTSGGSMVDYFKNKLPNFMTSRKRSTSESESDIANYGFGFSTQTDDTKTKKKRSHNNYELDETPKKKHKKKNVETESEGVVNPAFDPLSRKVIVSNHHVLDTISESDEHSQNCSVQDEPEVLKKNEQSECEVIRKIKKKKRNKDGIDNPCCDANKLDANPSSLEVTNKKKKKPKHYEDVRISLENNFESTISSKKKSKRNLETVTCFDNPGFGDANIINNNSSSTNIDNSFEVKLKKKSKNKKIGIENPTFDIEVSISQSTHNNNLEDVNEFEVKIKKKRKKFENGIDNPAFAVVTNTENIPDTDQMQVKKKKKKHREVESLPEENTETHIKIKKKHKHLTEIVVDEQGGIDNPVLNVNNSLSMDDCDLILNVTDTPVPPKPDSSKKSAKNVHFGKVHMEYIFQEVDDSESQRVDNNSSKKKPKGFDNAAFNLKSNAIEESINSLALSIENCQAEVENGINESKMKRVTYEERMIGELSHPGADDEPHDHGVIFRFKNATFSKKLPYWEKQNDVLASYPKRSYKHLIKGDIVVGFKNTNLHNVSGYGKPVKKKLRAV